MAQVLVNDAFFRYLVVLSENLMISYNTLKIDFLYCEVLTGLKM